MLKVGLIALAVVAISGITIAGGMALWDLFKGREERYREMHREHLKQQSRVDERFSNDRSDFLEDNP